MNLDVEFIIDRVQRHEDSRAPYLKRVQEWERMYRLDPGFGRTLQQAVEAGQEQIVTPAPFNIINMSERLLASTPRIDVIPVDPMDSKSVSNSEQTEYWLHAMWNEVNYNQGRNVLADIRWNILVRGRFAIEVKWIGDKIPKRLRKTMMPFRVQSLDPKSVGVRRGPITNEFVYVRRERTLLEVMREWGDTIEDIDKDSALWKKIARYEANRNRQVRDEDTVVEEIDYWEMDPETGMVRNAVLIDDEFAKPLEDTKYPEIPIVVGRGDFAVGLGDDYDGLSILHPIEGLWEYDCRLHSQEATALLWHFWPAITVQNEFSAPVDDVEISPGTTSNVPFGTKIEMHRIEPNIPLAQTLSGQIERYIDQSSYPPEVYGRTENTLQTGYAASLLGEAAKGRIKNYQEGLEMGLAHAHRVVFGLVETFGGKKGVDLYLVDERNREKQKLTLNKEIIGGIRQTTVKISPAIPQDNAARTSMGLQMQQARVISQQTFLDKFLDVPVPTDETKRIALEELMQSDEMRPYRMRRVAEEYYKEESLDMLFETPFMPPPPPGKEWVRGESGQVILEDVPPQPPPAPGPSMDQGPLPPEPQGPPGPMQLQPDMPFPGPQGGSPIAPVMQGMLEGETLGQPQDLNPLIFDQMVGTPGSDLEQLRMAGDLPPEGLPPGVV